MNKTILYAFKIIDYLIRHEGERVVTRDIAEAENIPPAYTSKILAKLYLQGIVTIKQGRTAFVKLNKGKITPRRITKAIHPPTAKNLDGMIPFYTKPDTDIRRIGE